MEIAYPLAVAHHLALIVLVSALAAETVLLRPGLSAADVRRLARVDALYGLAALALLGFGSARTVFGLKAGPSTPTIRSSGPRSPSFSPSACCPFRPRFASPGGGAGWPETRHPSRATRKSHGFGAGWPANGRHWRSSRPSPPPSGRISDVRPERRKSGKNIVNAERHTPGVVSGTMQLQGAG